MDDSSTASRAFSAWHFRLPVLATVALLLLGYAWGNSEVEGAWYWHAGLYQPGYMWERFPRQIACVTLVEIINPPIAVLAYAVPLPYEAYKLWSAQLFVPGAAVVSAAWWYLASFAIVALRRRRAHDPKLAFPSSA